MRSDVSRNETAEPVGAVAARPRNGKLSFAAVNGWRGPGAIVIAMGHFALIVNVMSYRNIVPAALLVDLFFVLSGLVIAQAYGEKLRCASAFPEYIVRRFGRIWPVQAATLGVLVGYELLKLVLQHVSGQHFSSGAFASDGPSLLAAIPTNLLLIQSLGLHDRETWDFPSWSLSVEFVTYASFAALCLIRHAPLRRALSLAIVLASLAVLIFLAPYQMRSTFDYGLFRCFAGFFAGVLCHDIAARWGRLLHWPMPTLVEIAAIAFVGLWMAAATDSNFAFAAPFVFCAFVLVFMGRGGAVSAILRTRPLQFLAELSFTIYMVHAIVLIAMLAVLHAIDRTWRLSLFATIANPFATRPDVGPTVEVLHLGAASVLALTLVYALAVYGAAILTYYYVEVPGRAIFARISKRVARRSTMAADDGGGVRSTTAAVTP